VLEAVSVHIGGCNMTNIMYASNVNCSVLRNILKDFIGRDLLTKDGKKYLLTEKGLKILYDYRSAWLTILGRDEPTCIPMFLRSVPNVGWK